MARVAMNGWTLKNWIRTPDATPNAEPMRTMTPIVTHGSHPALMSITPDTLLSAMIAPTERSMPPVRITNVIPTARMIRCALLMSRLDSVLACMILP